MGVVGLLWLSFLVDFDLGAALLLVAFIVLLVPRSSPGRAPELHLSLFVALKVGSFVVSDGVQRVVAGEIHCGGRRSTHVRSLSRTALARSLTRSFGLSQTGCAPRAPLVA